MSCLNSEPSDDDDDDDDDDDVAVLEDSVPRINLRARSNLAALESGVSLLKAM